MAVSVMDCDSLGPLEYWKVHWKEQVKSVGEISHPNLVKVLGYFCDDNKSLFLVFEYLHKGSLDYHFYGSKISSK
ncbi:unnamed protein product [Arabis nemorensis]|uniref:Protein kinase domain-containing protein n=1 Tax=Arabis nemorensis TaxID=586526 RepID=A0A565BA33_9BRAS|nr:unnamed protein product [Arabis nemorensis]